MNILLHGCNGRMGQAITKLAVAKPDLTIICGVDAYSNPAANYNPYPVFQSLDAIDHETSASVDVVIDFSNHTAIDSLLAFVKASPRKAALVLCTTGYTAQEKERFIEASKVVPVFNSGNMSIGVNLLISLLKQATATLFDSGSSDGNGDGDGDRTVQSDFDVEIVEKHHNQKLDAPSGTALMLADAVNSVLDGRMDYVYERESKMQKRTQTEIGIHSVRGGAIVGEHEVIFAGAGEVIELKHTALSRDVFAVGALRAAKYMCGKGPGLYSMQDVLKK